MDWGSKGEEKQANEKNIISNSDVEGIECRGLQKRMCRREYIYASNVCKS